eukprot:9610640-Ditylum_brightwellii.AAC.1
MTIALGDIISRKIQQGYDKFGRWNCIMLAGKNNKFINITMTYQHCKVNSTGTTTYHQQLALLQRVFIEIFNPG